MKNSYDVVIIGGGPAGIAAAVSCENKGLNVLIVEREENLGGILKQCIHDGFGLVTFNERLSGLEYAQRFIDKIDNEKIDILNKTFVIDVQRENNEFRIYLTNSSEGIVNVESKAIVLATGCRERTARQVFIGGTRPAGIYSAGTAQHLTNIEGYLPCKKCVILGSGDIGLIMARRLTLEGAKVLGVYEIKDTPSGLRRNISQCLDDFSIPLHLSYTVKRVLGEYRVEGVEVCKVDKNMNPIVGTEEIIPCDGLILSVGLIPENEVAESLSVSMDNRTKGPIVNQDFMTSVKGIFSCGNALHVNDLVDYVSESGQLTGDGVKGYLENNKNISREVPINYSNENIAYVVPQKINLLSKTKKFPIYFRSKDVIKDVFLNLKINGQVVMKKKYRTIRPPEMERIELDISKYNLDKDCEIELILDSVKVI